VKIRKDKRENGRKIKSINLIQTKFESEIQEIKEIEMTHEIDIQPQSKLTKRLKVQVLFKLRRQIENHEKMYL